VGHQVYARREGPSAILRCEVCQTETPLREGRFDELNEFIQEHKPCAMPSESGA
jgi:hypothetical protein